MNQSEKSAVVLGGGVSGIAAAWRLAGRGWPVTVLESAPHLGGLAGTVRRDGHCLDYGPHSFFTDDDEIRATVLGLFNPPLVPQPRCVKFLYNGNYLDYPITPETVLLQMGVWNGLRAAASFAGSKLRRLMARAAEKPADLVSVEDWAISSFGPHLYQTFFKPYTEQFWKRPCRDLAARTIPYHTRTSFANTLRTMLVRRPTRDGKSLIEREMLPTYYPDTGYGEITERMAQRAADLGGRVETGAHVLKVHLKKTSKLVVYEQRGATKSIEADTVISTLPVNLLCGMLEPSVPSDVRGAAQALEFRSLVVLGMVTEKQDVLPCSYMYLLDRPYNRISEMNRFSSATSPAGDNIILAEMPCLAGSSSWKASAEELFDMCIDSLARDRILMPGDVKKLLLVKAAHAYPVYKLGYAARLDRLKQFIDSVPNLHTLGRSGEFMYMDADKCIRRAFDLADRLSSAG